jgi:PAS domain S-box-containing protein
MSNYKSARKTLDFARGVSNKKVVPSVEIAASPLSIQRQSAEYVPISALRKQTEVVSFAAAFEASGHAMMIIGDDHVIVAFNSASEKLTGWRSDQALGHRCWEIYHCHGRRNGARGGCLCPLMGRKERFRSYFKHTFADREGKEISVSMSHAPFVSAVCDDGYEIIVAHHDSGRQTALLTGQELVGMAAHELITPLSVVKGYTTTLLQLGDTLADSEKRRYLHNMERVIGKACKAVDNFLDLYRFDAGYLDLDRQSISLPRLIRRIVTDMQEQTPQNVIKFTSSTSVPFVKIDCKRIEQVLANLLVNATKYSPSGSDIEVTLEYARNKNGLRATGADLSVVKPPCLIVSVRDSGIGIPDNELEYIFEKFYRVKSGTTRGKSGVGLGLHISKILIEAHGGHIWAKSDVGKGSTFSFSLPADNTDQSS